MMFVSQNTLNIFLGAWSDCRRDDVCLDYTLQVSIGMDRISGLAFYNRPAVYVDLISGYPAKQMLNPSQPPKNTFL